MNDPLKQLENHPQYFRAQADCFEILPVIPSGSVDLILTDPPYGVTACAWDEKPDIPRFFSESWRVLKPTGTILVFGVEPFSTTLRVACLGRYKYDLYWIKRRGSGFLHAKNAPLKQVEIVSVFSGGVVNHHSCSDRRMTYNPQGVTSAGKVRLDNPCVHTYGARPGSYRGKEYEAFSNFPTNILNFDEKQCQRIHPSEKPIDLLEWLVKTYTNEGETVLDPFMGSGSTGVACINLGRKFIGIEKDVHFFEVADKRIQAAIDNYQHKLPFFDD